jgi:transposase
MLMTNYLKMPKKSQVLALLELGWSYRRIEAETGVRRETVSRYDRMRQANAAKTFAGSEANPANTFPGSAPPARFAAARYHDAILEKRGKRLTAQRIWQDLTEEFGYGHSYESVKRYLRTIAPRGRPVGVFESEPGQEGQVDFFRGAPTFDAATGQWKRPWVFRLTLSCSRHGSEEAVWDQQLETFLRLHEHAFRDLGGVPVVVRLDNLKSGVFRACFYDPDVNEVYAAFARHWNFTPLPIQPRRPEENGKQERSGG